jgi:syntaxin-binding protein 1
MQGFITNNERALEELFGDEENNRKAVACLNVMATRIASVFASLRVCNQCSLTLAGI